MERSCPSCKANIEGAGEYFCPSCGFKLPDELVTSDVRSTLLRLDPPPFEIREEISSSAVLGIKRFVVPVFSLCLLLTLLGYIYYYYTTNLNKIKVSTSTVNVKEERIVEIKDLDVPTTKFINQPLVEHVPYEADIFIQGKSIFRLISALLDIKKLNELVGGNINFNDLDAVSNQDFVVFSKPEATSSSRLWGVVAKIENTSAAQKLVESTKEATWSAVIMDDYILYSNNKGLEEEVRSAKKKIKLNAALNPKFALAKNSVVSEGKLIVFVLNDSAKNYVKDMKSDFLTSSFTKIRDSVLAKDKSSVVVN